MPDARPSSRTAHAASTERLDAGYARVYVIETELRHIRGRIDELLDDGPEEEVLRLVRVQRALTAEVTGLRRDLAALREQVERERDRAARARRDPPPAGS